METSIHLCVCGGGGGHKHIVMFSLSLSPSPESQLIVDCNIATNKTTGLVTISALWHIQGLESDVAAIDRYNLRVFWGEMHNNIPITVDEIKTVINYTTSTVSGIKLIIMIMCVYDCEYVAQVKLTFKFTTDQQE